MPTLEFRSASGKRLPVAPIGFEPFDDHGQNDPFRVRDLIEKLVNESVRDFHRRESDRPLALLTSEAIAEGLWTGKFGSPREDGQRVQVDVAVANALQAFEDKLYLLFVDDVEKRSLDELVNLQPDTRLVLIRLTALSGA
ncbi:MAG: hypothetical protein SFX74_05205 [Fimbriimonadaceae bacterium]|nr:hypothetical protein [Fimbriimonadaceae bacterium]